MQRTRAAAALVVVLATCLLTSPVFALYDFGPLRPYRADNQILDAEGFPAWYRDESGLVCMPCLHPDPNGVGPCLSTRTVANEMPDEFFYYHITANLAGPNGFNMLYINALEGAYANGPVAKGDEMVFQRTRIRINCPAANPRPGAPYTFEVTTPFGEVIRETSTVGGRRCVDVTVDIGLNPGAFGESLSGPMKSYIKADPAPPPTPGFPPQLGAFPTGTRAVLPGGAVAVLSVTSPGGPGATSVFPGTVSTQTFTTSCQQYPDSTLALDAATVRANPATGAPVLDAWAVAGPAETPSASVGTVSRPMARNTNSASNPPVPTTFTTNLPTTYMASLPLPAPAAGTPWIFDLRVASGAVTVTKTVRPLVTGTATYTGDVLTVTATTPDPTQKFTISLKKADGTFSPMSITPAGAPATATFTSTVVGTLSTPAPPAAVWACMDAVPARNLPQQCTEMRTVSTNAPA